MAKDRSPAPPEDPTADAPARPARPRAAVGRRLVYGALSVLTVVAAVVAVPALSASAANVDPHRRICYQPWVQGHGWGDGVCDGEITGSMDMSVPVEAWSISESGAGRICALASLEGFGWQNWRCAPDSELIQVGAPGWGMAVDGLWLHAGSGRLCAKVLVVRPGEAGLWQDVGCASGDSSVGWSPFNNYRIQALVTWFESTG